MRLRKTSYASIADGLDIPIYVFEPLELRGERGHPALVWIHGGVHGDLDPLYFPFIKEALERGYVVLAPEYRGSTGYGRAHQEAIDYGGYEVEDCLTAVSYMARRMPHVDPNVSGSSAGATAASSPCTRYSATQTAFKAAAAMVPVTNLVFRLSFKGPRYAERFVRQKRIGGQVHERRRLYIERSPLYQIDRLRTPLLVHVADNDRDVDFVEAQAAHPRPGVQEARAWPRRASTSIRRSTSTATATRSNRRVDRARGYVRADSRAQRDSWNRIWTFLEWHLEPYRTDPGGRRGAARTMTPAAARAPGLLAVDVAILLPGALLRPLLRLNAALLPPPGGFRFDATHLPSTSR